MTVTNHMMTGALIAVAVQRPLLAIPLAFLSHFVIDIVPHYGYGEVSFDERDTQKHFLKKQTADTYFALALFWLVPFATRDHQAPIVTMLCMLVAFIPDAIWPYQYVMAHRRGGYAQPDWYSRFHKSIQWYERPWGIYVEAIWFLLTILGMRLLIA